jgi:hypothetical protein
MLDLTLTSLIALMPLVVGSCRALLWASWGARCDDEQGKQDHPSETAV